MAGRKPLYYSDDEKPVSVSLRVPRTLYDQVQQYVDMRRMTMTDAIVESLRLWLETPADPRAALLSGNSNTVMQEWEALVDARIEAKLSSLLSPAVAPVSTDNMQPFPDDIPPSSDNIPHYSSTVIQKTPSASVPEGVPPFDVVKYRLGKLCPQRHEWGTSGQSLRVNNRSGYCRACNNEAKREKRLHLKTVRTRK